MFSTYKGCLQVASNYVADDIADNAAASEEFATTLLDRVAFRVVVYKRHSPYVERNMQKIKEINAMPSWLPLALALLPAINLLIDWLIDWLIAPMLAGSWQWY